MFGQSGNTSFSGFNATGQTSLFGQSAFGKPNSATNFGSGTTPVFGSSNTSLFSSNPTGSTTGGLFGSTTTPPAFRQPTNTQPSFGAGFGTQNANTSLFGSQQNASTNLFGTSSSTSAFGQSNKPGGFTFGTASGSNLFGQPQSTQQNTPFAQNNPTGTTNLFGTTPGFGSTNTTSGVTGTVVKFTPVITTDSMCKNGISHNISARHCCIASMKEYESKSYEELRFEDYSVGRKGPSTGLFGTTTSITPFCSAGSGFGSMTGSFGTTSQPGSGAFFTKTMPTFGTPATTTTNSFVFNSTSSSNLFGTNTQAKPFSGFGTIGTNSTQNSGFGFTFGSGQPNQSIGLLNQNKPAFNVSSTSSGTGGFSSFGTPANTATPLFSAKTTGATGFGTTSTFAASTVPSFGPNTGFSTGQNTTTPLFNMAFKPTGQTPAFTFCPTSASSAGLGTNTGLTLNTGCSLFGQQKPAGLFGNSANNTTFSTSGSFGSLAFGANSNTNTGVGVGLLNNGTMANQAKNSSSVPVHQQILALVSAPFGDSPLLKNLLPASGKAEELLKPANAASKLLNGPQYKVTTNNKSPKIKARVVTAAQLSKKSLFEGLEEEDAVLSEAFQPRPNAKRLVLRPKPIVNATGQSPNENSHSLDIHSKEEKTEAYENSIKNTEAYENCMKNTEAYENCKKNTEAYENSIKNTEAYENCMKNTEAYENSIKNTDKENQNQDTNRQFSTDRRSSTYWLKSGLLRRLRMQQRDGTEETSGDEIKEDSFAGQRLQYSFNGSSTEDGMSNTVTEFRPRINALNQTTYTEGVINCMNAGLNSSVGDKNNVDIITLRNNDSTENLDSNSFSAINSERIHSVNAAGVTLRRVGYYTIPPIDKLDSYVSEETCIVPHFTVGREGYGNVYFPDSVDIYGLNLDEIVHFRHKEVIIYPDDEKKPPIGQGLNRPAQVTLDKVWPHDKSLHEPITDPHRLAALNYEGKLRRVSAKHDTRFLEYRPETGSWVFKVDHFSKYGLSDSDEEESNSVTALTNDPKKLKPIVTSEKLIGKLEQEKTSVSFGFQSKTDRSNINGTVNNKIGDIRSDTEQASATDPEASILSKSVVIQSQSTVIDYNGSEAQLLLISPTGDNARFLGTDSHKLQLMKASFFDSNEEEADRELRSISRFPVARDKLTLQYPTETCEPTMRENCQLNRCYTSKFYTDVTIPTHVEPVSVQIDPEIKTKRQSIDGSSSMYKLFSDPTIIPMVTVLNSHSEMIPLKESVINKLRSRCFADTGIQMGRMFKPSWGRRLTFLSLSTQDQASKISLYSCFEHLGSYVSGRQAYDTTSTTIVQRIQIFGGCGADKEQIQAFKESIEGHLRIQLSNCVVGQEGECPVFGVDARTTDAALHAHFTLAQELAHQPTADRFTIYVANVWKLCVALWGNLPDIHFSTGNAKHYDIVARREAIGGWLKEVVQKPVEHEITEITNREKIILQLLTAFKLEEACETARRSGDYCLALLMAQLRSGMPVRDLIKQQLALWQETDMDKNLSVERLKLFSLVAGEPLILSKHGTINVCEGLDWKRALAVHLWYLSPPTASIRDALELYENSFDTKESNIYASPPIPEYMETDYEVDVNGFLPIFDLCFHLLKLYCTGDHELGVLLNPSTHTTDPLDYRLSWLIQQLLLSLGYSHLSEHVAALTHTNFATQLEAFGLWHWAVFVLLHLQDRARRQAAVTDMLQRHVEVNDISDYMEREQFLREELGIPSAWIHRAKAVKSFVTKRYGEAAWYYIQAEEWNSAHDIIIEHLAADAIINENYEYLRSLLGPLVPNECCGSISGWLHQGQLLWDYMEITIDVEGLLHNSDLRTFGYKLESLKPRLTSLCLKINQFPCMTAKHRLCQAEIAKRTLYLARSLIMMQLGENRSIAKILMNIVAQLPLPEDYVQQELRPIVNMRVAEVVPQSA